jgi:hypothetical protein
MFRIRVGARGFALVFELVMGPKRLKLVER